MKIDAIPAGFDTGMNNLMWIITSTATNSAVVVDPGYAAPIIDHINQNNLVISDVLITHHHHDHTDGVEALLRTNKNITVYGPKNSPFKPISAPLEENDVVQIEQVPLNFRVIAVPGHTMDHISFYDEKHNLCFVGDTVFGAGAGALFEGTADTFWQSTQKIMHLPHSTTLYYGHDYTIQNLQFALKLEPDNQHVIERLGTCKNQQYRGFDTVQTEHLTNPFWRCHVPKVKKSCEAFAKKKLNSDLEVFATVRQWR